MAYSPRRYGDDSGGGGGGGFEFYSQPKLAGVVSSEFLDSDHEAVPPPWALVRTSALSTPIAPAGPVDRRTAPSGNTCRLSVNRDGRRSRLLLQPSVDANPFGVKQLLPAVVNAQKRRRVSLRMFHPSSLSMAAGATTQWFYLTRGDAADPDISVTNAARWRIQSESGGLVSVHVHVRTGGGDELVWLSPSISPLVLSDMEFVCDFYENCVEMRLRTGICEFLIGSAGINGWYTSDSRLWLLWRVNTQANTFMGFNDGAPIYQLDYLRNDVEPLEEIL